LLPLVSRYLRSLVCAMGQTHHEWSNEQPKLVLVDYYWRTSLLSTTRSSRPTRRDQLVDIVVHAVDNSNGYMIK
jgi:hypothetical protein